MSIEKLFDNTNRPLSITILGWILTVTGFFTLYGLLSFLNPEVIETLNHTGVNVYYAFVASSVSGLVNLIAGYGILNRIEWSRMLYIVFTPIGILVSSFFLVSDFALILIGFLFYFISSALLFSHSAKAFFNNTFATSEITLRLKAYRSKHQRQSWVAKSFGILTAICSGSLLITLSSTLFSIRHEMIPMTIIIFSVPIILFYILTCTLWGYTRWLAILGWIFSVIGAMTIYSGFSITLISNTMAWKLSETIEINTNMFVIIGLIGLIPLSIGVYFLYLQYKKDLKSIESEIISETSIQ